MASLEDDLAQSARARLYEDAQLQDAFLPSTVLQATGDGAPQRTTAREEPLEDEPEEEHTPPRCECPPACRGVPPAAFAAAAVAVLAIACSGLVSRAAQRRAAPQASPPDQEQLKHFLSLVRPRD